jgi:hypothetical protein
MSHIAQLNGELTGLGGAASASCYFEWGTTVAYGNTTNIQILTAIGTYYEIIDNLLPLTTYHYRAVATNIIGTTYGVDVEFTTSYLSSDVIVRTDDATNILSNSGTLNGTLLYDAGLVCEVRFEYGKTISYGMTTNWQPNKVTGDTFSATLIEIGTNVIIHYRAVARSPYGVSYGKDIVFTTLNRDTYASTALDPMLQLMLQRA